MHMVCISPGRVVIYTSVSAHPHPCSPVIFTLGSVIVYIINSCPTKLHPLCWPAGPADPPVFSAGPPAGLGRPAALRRPAPRLPPAHGSGGGA